MQENEENKVDLLHQARTEYEKQYQQWPAADIRDQLPYEVCGIIDVLEPQQYLHGASEAVLCCTER